MSSEHMECSECGATMLLDNDKIMLVCPFCGNREPLALMRGFNKDYNRQDTYFYGYDNQGNHLTVEYRGYNIVEISVYAESN